MVLFIIIIGLTDFKLSKFKDRVFNIKLKKLEHLTLKHFRAIKLPTLHCCTVLLETFLRLHAASVMRWISTFLVISDELVVCYLTMAMY